MSTLARCLPALLSCTLLLSACGATDAPETPSPMPAPAARGPAAGGPAAGTPAGGVREPAAQSEAAPRWPTMNTTRPAPDGAAMATLTAVRFGGHEGYDRVVFELSGPVGVSATWTDAVVACGSGRPVQVEGSAFLELTLDPAQAHDEGGQATIEERDRSPDVPTIAHAVQTCDYEGQVRWALGLPEKTGMRVLQLEDPDRIVVDLQR